MFKTSEFIALADAMALAKVEGSTLLQKVVCPYCKEELDRKDREKFPIFCSACGSDLPEGLELSICPQCGRNRKTLKNGKPAVFCAVCRYKYNTITVSIQKGIYSHSTLNVNIANKL